jgi:hypothetical protein
LFHGGLQAKAVWQTKKGRTDVSFYRSPAGKWIADSSSKT